MDADVLKMTSDYLRAEATLAAALAKARAEGEAAGYRRAIDDVCRFLDDEQMLAWSTSCSPHGDWFAKGVQHAMSGVRRLAPVAPQPVSKADELPAAGAL